MFLQNQQKNLDALKAFNVDVKNLLVHGNHSQHEVSL